MLALHQFDYLFAIGMIFAFLDAWNIGANDVANSFATSVSSRSLTYMQAMILAAMCEFLGAVLLGNRVADTIRNKIISVKLFEDSPATLMLGMVCAVVGSSTWLTIATRIGAPVSTTHSIVGAIIGVGIATYGGDGVVWGWKGFSQIVASWFIAPGVAGCFAAILFLITKFLVLERGDKALRNAFFVLPVYFCFTTSVLTLVIVWKSGAQLNVSKLTPAGIAAAVLGVAGATLLIYLVFFLPYLQRRIVKEDWTIKWYHIFIGPLLWNRGEIPPAPPGTSVVQDYYRGHRVEESEQSAGSIEKGGLDNKDVEVGMNLSESESSNVAAATDVEQSQLAAEEKTGLAKYPIWHPLGVLYKVYRVLTHGIRQDVVTYQQSGSGGFLAGDVKRRNKNVPHYDNKVEHLYSFLQALTAGTASFAHGSNDVANAIGPLTTIYLVWTTNTIASKANVPVWILVYGGVAIVIGLWTYGYNIMRNLGNRLTLHSPSRGFSMELGAAITVIFATKLGLPISTTQCIVGATVFVGLCNNDLKAINYRMVAWCYAGWILTLPCAGLISGILMGIIINAPHFEAQYELMN
ncbi:phosphate transporter [Lipomyces tetrasporus]|uniref:Phosphate transporter n=1 Tax=Lipomyces tetrasporus TaxID=54092 RepID=A0AAD7VUU8_9ASCO|nr:phosphate transporter [Lipomyces tetrasporus]KAJ8102356.1 phosphate transporter [Lipomyces tetrasporus]